MIIVRVAFPGVVYEGRYIKEEALYNCFAEINLESGNLVVCDMKEREPRLGRVLSVNDLDYTSEPVSGWIIQKVDMTEYKKRLVDRESKENKQHEEADLDDLLGL
jgi:hypothetical protein